MAKAAPVSRLILTPVAYFTADWVFPRALQHDMLRRRYGNLLNARKEVPDNAFGVSGMTACNACGVSGMTLAEPFNRIRRQE